MGDLARQSQPPAAAAAVCYDRFRASPAGLHPAFAGDVSQASSDMSWRKELAGVVAREQRRVKGFDANGVRERLARAQLPTGGEARRRLEGHLAVAALRRMALKEITRGDALKRIGAAQKQADPVEAMTALILQERAAKQNDELARERQAAAAAAQAAKQAGLIGTVAQRATARPATADGPNGTARQRGGGTRRRHAAVAAQRRRRSQPKPFDIRAVAARPWTGHERGEQLPIGHRNMKEAGYQDRTRPYVRPSEQQSSRASSADTQTRLANHAEFLRNSRIMGLQRGGYRRGKDFSRPSTPEFWYKQSLDGSRIDIATDGVFAFDGLSGGQGPSRCLIKTREVRGGGRVVDRLDDVVSMSGALGLSLPPPQQGGAHSHFPFAEGSDEAASVMNISRPSTADAPVPQGALRRLGTHECGLDEGSDSWLVGQASSEKNFDFVRALKRGEKVA